MENKVKKTTALARAKKKVFLCSNEIPIGTNRRTERHQLTCQLSCTLASLKHTFIAIKFDGVQHGLVGGIIKRFKEKRFCLMAVKFLWASEEHLKQRYVDWKDHPFFPGPLKHLNSGHIGAMVWEGLNLVKRGRVMLRETNPAYSKPGTIRGESCIQGGRNITCGSDSVESLWFKSEELVDYKSRAHDWGYEQTWINRNPFWHY
ncbi:nucleoside diphosphate kinase B-like [Mus musculus]|uniref:nucleoside diphosphate kinase B-like n=1 Tax=Mus musculus TaxID=10090 RepID=UPI0001552CAD|nr:nucleoside diphosphate kinase B-like [Mus musculus]